MIEAIAQRRAATEEGNQYVTGQLGSRPPASADTDRSDHTARRFNWPSSIGTFVSLSPLPAAVFRSAWTLRAQNKCAGLSVYYWMNGRVSSATFLIPEEPYCAMATSILYLAVPLRSIKSKKRSSYKLHKFKGNSFPRAFNRWLDFPTEVS